MYRSNLGIFSCTALFLTLLTLLASVPHTASAATIGTNRPWAALDGLVGYWSFNGPDVSGTTASDRSGRGNDGTLINGPTPARGKLGQALNFDGTDDYVNAWSDASLDAIVNLTACAWVRQDTFLTWAAIVSKNYWELQFANSSSHIEFARTFDGTSGNWQTTGSIPVGEWGHVCVTYNNSSAANDPSIYINGELQSLTESNTPTGTASDDSASNLVMGQWTGTGNDPLDGQLDEVRVYNRILTPAEVRALYRAGQVTIAKTLPTAVKTGLVGWWTFDGPDLTDKVYDRSGQNNHGYVYDVATNTIKVGGRIGQGTKFNGVNGYIDMGDINAIDGVTAMTASAWIRTTATDERHIFDKGDCGGAADSGTFELFTSAFTSGKAGFTIYPSGGIPDSTQPLEGSVSVNDGKWHLITGNYDGANIRLYVDGVLDAGPWATAVTLSSNSRKVQIGGDCNNNGSYEWNGNIDDVRIYNRALSATEIKKIYTEGAGIVVGKSQPNLIPSGLVGYWSFNGPDFTDKVYDRSGQNNHGYVYGAATSTIKFAGKIGQGIKLDGVNDYIEAGSAAIIDDITQKTVCQWIYPKSIPVTFADVVTKLGVGTGWAIELNSTDGNNRFEYFQETSGATNGSWKSPVDSVPFSTWSHVCVSYDNSSLTNNPVIYINGLSVTVSELSTPTGAIDVDSAATLRIGSWDGVNEFYDGKIDEVRIYNRILTSAEVKKLYQSGR